MTCRGGAQLRAEHTAGGAGVSPSRNGKSWDEKAEEPGRTAALAHPGGHRPGRNGRSPNGNKVQTWSSFLFLFFAGVNKVCPVFCGLGRVGRTRSFDSHNGHVRHAAPAAYTVNQAAQFWNCFFAPHRLACFSTHITFSAQLPQITDPAHSIPPHLPCRLHPPASAFTMGHQSSALKEEEFSKYATLQRCDHIPRSWTNLGGGLVRFKNDKKTGNVRLLLSSTHRKLDLQDSKPSTKTAEGAPITKTFSFHFKTTEGNCRSVGARPRVRSSAEPVWNDGFDQVKAWVASLQPKQKVVQTSTVAAVEKKVVQVSTGAVVKQNQVQKMTDESDEKVKEEFKTPQTSHPNTSFSLVPNGSPSRSQRNALWTPHHPDSKRMAAWYTELSLTLNPGGNLSRVRHQRCPRPGRQHLLDRFGVPDGAEIHVGIDGDCGAEL
ncbi:hypothetical protein BDK51DRAFT_50612 [Blyttiomyces helicus]|uniref:Uncharacterized protein n=1 Tax=Blyttiomyces helicus TaxID=388810 RepID=A0A4V1IQQ2_9FUNG|nr:hypothetical protein BDK51DRAFT_50612 [Blyttiomyces helicus]|eukprot:RKO87347.1 hypothetical protein BDK51DRAFT_50612 [Blyttiomyces helicus]